MIITAYGFSLSLHPNSMTLDSAPEEPLALVGVALANNLGTDIPRSNQIPVNLPQDVAPVQTALMKDGIVAESFFDEHFRRISEVGEVVSLDVPNYIKVHKNNAEALEDYIQKLDGKREEAKTAINSLTQLRDFHNNAVTASQTNIKNTQTAIEQSFIQKNSSEIMDGLSRLEELNIELQEHRHVSIFSGRFLAEYTTIMNTAEKKLAVLRTNKDALVK